MNKHSLIKGALILMLAGVLAKALGAVYRIPLTYIITPEGLGFYQLVYPVFALLLVLSSTGAPTAISTIVSSFINKGQYANAKKVFKISLVILLVLGIVAGLGLCLFSGQLAFIQGNVQIAKLYVCISVAIPLVSILSAFRGYFLGLLNMTPTAVSQIIEQFFKLVLGLLLSWALLKFGIDYATLGAVLGVVLSEFLAVVYMLFYYNKHKIKSINAQEKVLPTRHLCGLFIKRASPIILCSFVLPLLQMLDSLLVIKLLGVAGIDSTQATIMWGLYSGVVNSLINLPVALSLSVAVAVAPNVSGEDKKTEVANNINTAHTMALNIVLPCAVVLGVLGSNIISFLYQHSFVSGQINQLELASQLLVINAPFILFIAFVQIQNSVLQGLKHSNFALFSMLLAGAVKVGVLCLLTQNPDVNIFGVVIANISFYIVAFFINLVFLLTKIKWRFNYKKGLPCLFSSIIMGIYLYVGTYAFSGLSVYIKLPILLFIGVCVYFSTLCVLGGAKGLLYYLKSFKNKVYNKKTS